jgi:hypothetical protein
MKLSMIGFEVQVYVGISARFASRISIALRRIVVDNVTFADGRRAQSFLLCVAQFSYGILVRDTI